jgi:hypothetical protein
MSVVLIVSHTEFNLSSGQQISIRFYQIYYVDYVQEPLNTGDLRYHCAMRKEIVIPDTLIRDLKQIAFNADKSVKKYMEDVVINDIREKAKKLSGKKV